MTHLFMPTIFNEMNQRSHSEFVSPSIVTHGFSYPAGNYMFQVNNRKTRTRCEIYGGVVLVSLLLTLNIFHTLF